MTSFPENFNETVIKAYDEGFPLLMPRWGYVASAFVLFLIGFFGFFLNLMVILLMFKDRQLWTPLNIILFNLVCSDFSVSVLGNPFTLISSLFHRWIFGHTMCVLYGFFMALLGITSITTLTVISFERYLMVTRPLSSRHLSSKGAVLSIMFIWMYSLALTTPPLMGWGNYVNEAANISCSVNWHEQSMNTLTYIMFLFAMGQIVPLSIITFSYVNIIRTLKRNSQRLGRVSRAEARATAMVFIMIISFTVAWTPYSLFALMEQFATEGIISPGAGVIPALVAKSSICYDPLIYVGMNTQNSQRLGRVSRAEARATAMVFIMIISFTVAWTPYSLFALMEQFATEGIISPGAGVIPALVAKSSICYDPLIYVGMNTQFRQSIKRIFGIHSKQKQSQTERGYNNTVMSPAHKLSGINETTRFNSTDSTVSTFPKKHMDTKMVTDEVSEASKNDFHKPLTRNLELCTIQETRTASDAERSGDTVYDDESSSNRKLDMFGASCKVLSERSPVLTFMDSERLLFSRIIVNQNDDKAEVIPTKNVYGNEAFEEHMTDETNKDTFDTENESESFRMEKMIRQSYSLDFGKFSAENKKRKLSVETKLESFIQPKGFFKDTISKIFDQEAKQGHDSFKSFLCEKRNTENL